MNIYSWNVLYENKTFDDVYTFIQELDFDVLALQEVPEHFLEKLRTLPFELCESYDWVHRDATGKEVPIYVVIISKFPILETLTIPFPEELYKPENQLPRAQLFRKIMGWSTFFRSKTALRVSLDVDGTNVHVYSTHLSVLRPQDRKVEFETIAKNIQPDTPSIICGDLNVFESPQANLMNWLMGGSILDMLLLKRERRWFEKRFKELRFQNPLRRKKTHPIAWSQIDHILVPEEILVQKKGIVRKTYGSDHNPVMVSVELKKK